VKFVLALVAIVLVSCSRPKKEEEDGTKRMAERLEQIAATSDPDKDPFQNRRRAEILRKRLATRLPTKVEVDTRLEMALEYLRAGESEIAVAEFQAAAPIIEKLDGSELLRSEWLLDRFLGLAYMRLGEQQNCIARHTTASCLLPLEKEGLHEIVHGSSNAVRYLTRALRRNPQDPETGWLLNLAYMTLGQYPQALPRAWLVPPKAFESDYDIKRFPDVAEECGVAVVGLAGGVAMEDFDNDGDLDLMVSSWGLRDQIRYFANTGSGKFVERTKEAKLTGIVSGLNLIHADYNNDGFRDVLVLRGAWRRKEGAHPNSLLRNNGDGTFSDVTEAAGLLSFHPTQTGTWFDFNGDGHLDLFIGNESSAGNPHPCELYRNNGNGSFTECAEAAGVNVVGFVKGVVSGDYDNDGWPDLYLSHFQEPNNLFRNMGGKRFEEVTASAGVAEPVDSFPCWFWDYDNDGDLDLFVSSYSYEASIDKVAADYMRLENPGEVPRLYRNNGDGTFTDVAKPMQLNRVLVTMGCNFGDLDNDGWLDFYAGTGDPTLSSLMPNRMFRNDAGKVFQDVTTSGGFGHVQKGHGIAFGDVDNDGDQDVFAVLGGAYEGDGFQRTLFRNPGHGNNWVTLRLQGTKSNRDAIGARVEVRMPERTIYRTISTGGSFGSESLQEEIGLGSATRIEAITIQWPLPNKPRQTFTNVPINTVVSIREGDSQIKSFAGRYKSP
jgi:hypothetical protein